MLPYNCYIETEKHISGEKLTKVRNFLEKVGLDFDSAVDFTAVVYSSPGEVIATASLQKNVLKCIGISPEWQGEGLTASLMTCLLTQCAEQGYSQQFLYTKPINAELFCPFGFSELARTSTALLMERPSGSIQSYLDSLPVPPSTGQIGAVVAHCNPITNGHLYLIETALQQCDFLYVLILSEDRGEVPAHDRMMLVCKALQSYERVAVCPAGPYLISSATFPAYFLRNIELAQQAWCELDVQMFIKWFVPKLRITRRFVGSEPFSPVTAAYNKQLLVSLPRAGVEVIELERKRSGDKAISASQVRALLRAGCGAALQDLVPTCTLEYFSDPDACAEAHRRLATSIN